MCDYRQLAYKRYAQREAIDCLKYVKSHRRGLALVEFSLVDAHGTLRENVDPAAADIREEGAGLDCGLGMFVFRKPA